MVRNRFRKPGHGDEPRGFDSSTLRCLEDESPMGASLVASECAGHTVGFESSVFRYVRVAQRQKQPP